MSRLCIILLVLAFAGCGSAASGARADLVFAFAALDSSVGEPPPTPPDLSAKEEAVEDAGPPLDFAALRGRRDLASPVTPVFDLSQAVCPAICPASALAAVPCAYQFFCALTACFQAQGPCEFASEPQCPAEGRRYCWPKSGAIVHHCPVQGPPGEVAQDTFTTGPNYCFIEAVGAPGSLDYFKTGLVGPPGKNSILSYDEATGAVVCPDGSMHNIGLHFGGCAEVEDMLGAPKLCARGKC